MRYVVSSGEYRTVLDRVTPKEAAQDAINLWQLKKNKPALAKILMIVSPEKKELFMSTETLLESSQ